MEVSDTRLLNPKTMIVGTTSQLAKPWLLCHLMMILLVEPLADEFGVSPS